MHTERSNKELWLETSRRMDAINMTEFSVLEVWESFMLQFHVIHRINSPEKGNIHYICTHLRQPANWEDVNDLKRTLLSSVPSYNLSNA